MPNEPWLSTQARFGELENITEWFHVNTSSQEELCIRFLSRNLEDLGSKEAGRKASKHASSLLLVYHLKLIFLSNKYINTVYPLRMDLCHFFSGFSDR